MWYVYILLCVDGSFYTGITTNLEQRFSDHKNGKGGKFTKTHKVKSLVYSEEVPDKSTALKRELEIKGWSKEKKIKILNIKI